jgi:DNA repair protein RadC
VNSREIREECEPSQQAIVELDRAARREVVRTVEGPRERLEKLGARALSDAELVALLLRTGGNGFDSTELARGLLQSAGGLVRLAREEMEVLCEARGMGPAKSATWVAACEIGRRLATRRLEVGARILGPSDVYRHFFEELRGCESERFHALLLDGRHRVTGDVLVSQGTLTASLVHPREVFRAAVRRSAAALVLVHNHPSGDPAPSAEDRQVTDRLVRAGELLGIRVLDHVVVAEGGYHSFTESGSL